MMNPLYWVLIPDTTGKQVRGHCDAFRESDAIPVCELRVHLMLSLIFHLMLSVTTFHHTPRENSSQIACRHTWAQRKASRQHTENIARAHTTPRATPWQHQQQTEVGERPFRERAGLAQQVGAASRGLQGARSSESLLFVITPSALLLAASGHEHRAIIAHHRSHDVRQDAAIVGRDDKHAAAVVVRRWVQAAREQQRHR